MKDEIVLYQPNETIQLEVHLKDETVWLTQQQMADLFGTQRQAITKHLKNIFDTGELDKIATCSILELVATIYTKNFTKQLSLDIAQHNKQFAPIDVEPFNLSHDRFMIIDDVVYHIGASLKDLGKAWFAFTKMNDISANELLVRIK